MTTAADHYFISLVRRRTQVVHVGSKPRRGFDAQGQHQVVGVLDKIIAADIDAALPHGSCLHADVPFVGLLPLQVRVGIAPQVITQCLQPVVALDIVYW